MAPQQVYGWGDIANVYEAVAARGTCTVLPASLPRATLHESSSHRSSSPESVRIKGTEHGMCDADTFAAVCYEVPTDAALETHGRMPNMD